MDIALWLFVMLVLALGVYIGSAPIMAYVSFKSRPREAMAWCHKHGHFRKQFIIQMGPAEVCPTCYLEAIQGTNGKVTLFK